MRKVTGLLSICFFLLSASYVASGDKVKLKLKAPRSIFMKPTGMYTHAPVNVRVRAELEGTPENPEEYYCLEEEWDWGDDTESFHEPDCDPYEAGAELKRIYNSTHTFRYPGNYTIYLRLQRGGDTIITSKVTVRIRGS